MKATMRNAEKVMRNNSALQLNPFAYAEVRYYAYFSFFILPSHKQRKLAA